MKISEEYILRNIAGDKVVIPTGSATMKFNGLITLNEVGAFIWEHVDKVQTREELVQLVLASYEVEEERAKHDVEGFLSMLKERNILIEE